MVTEVEAEVVQAMAVTETAAVATVKVAEARASVGTVVATLAVAVVGKVVGKVVAAAKETAAVLMGVAEGSWVRGVVPREAVVWVAVAVETVTEVAEMEREAGVTGQGMRDLAAAGKGQAVVA